MARDDPVEVEAELRHETDRAFLIFDGEREIWLPKSLVKHDGHGEFTMPEWLAMQEELI